MSILEMIRKRWVTVTLYVVMSLFFLGACLVSMNTYGAIAQAQHDIRLENPHYDAEIVRHGHLNISFSVELVNPSRYTLHVITFSWYASISNSSSPTDRVIPVGDEYVGPTQYVEIAPKSTVNLTYWTVVSDSEVLSKLFGFINYSLGLGQSYTLETLPYVHEFTASMTIGEFEHDYVRERYLNFLVTAELRYSSTEDAP